LGRGLTNLIVVIAISEVPIFTRLIRAATMSVKQEEYVLAAKATGENDLNIIFRYILPNCLSLITVQATLRLGTSVLTAAGLGFLGIGITPPMPEWGAMMNDARSFLSVAPHIEIAPGLAIVLFVLGFNFFGDGLNDVLNPKSKNR
jgi:peptide/nickel transport system permease protein